jgi:hypothetical protein
MNGSGAPLMTIGETDGWIELQQLANDMHVRYRDATALAQ